jgi:hypothetical protein
MAIQTQPTTVNHTMKIVKIDSKDVDEHPENYNSYFHTAIEAPDFPIPTEIPQYYTRWLPLISQSQLIPPQLIHTFALTPTQGRLLLSATQASIHTRELNRIYAEELSDTVIPILSSLTFPPKGLFLRLDASSPKDGVGGTQPLESADEVVLRLTTSHRAMNAITKLVEGAQEIPMYFLPFNDKMMTEKEFHVFCPPGEGNITAVSQYKWHARSIFASLVKDELELILWKVFGGIQYVHEEILEMVKKRSDELDELMLKQGFTFDVLWDGERERCELIELNSFGTRSGCGTCLFHWLRDGLVLYGKNWRANREIEFRISV